MRVLFVGSLLCSETTLTGMIDGAALCRGRRIARWEATRRSIFSLWDVVLRKTRQWRDRQSDASDEKHNPGDIPRTHRCTLHLEALIANDVNQYPITWRVLRAYEPLHIEAKNRAKRKLWVRSQPRSHYPPAAPMIASCSTGRSPSSRLSSSNWFCSPNRLRPPRSRSKVPPLLARRTTFNGPDIPFDNCFVNM